MPSVRHAPSFVLVPLLLLGACASEPVKEPVQPAPLPGPVAVADFTIAKEQVAIGEIKAYVIRPDDTMLDVAREADLGYTQLIAANRGVDAWKPEVGRQIVLPEFYLLPDGPHRGIVINLVQQRLFYFPPAGDAVETFPIGVGVQGKNTPMGTTKVVEKAHEPRLDRAAVDPRGGQGTCRRRCRRDRITRWAISPSASAGPAISFTAPTSPTASAAMSAMAAFISIRRTLRGCSARIPIGTQVRVVDQPVETGWIDDELYIAVFPDKDQAEALDVNQPVPTTMPRDLHKIVRHAAGKQADRVDWTAVDAAGRERSGIPVKVSTPHVAAGT